MTKLQWLVIFSAIGLFFVLYFGCNTKPEKQLVLEKTRAMQAESTDISVLLKNAKERLSSSDNGRIFLLEQELAQLEDDSLRILQLQRLSGAWFELGHPAISGYYAQEIAEQSGTEESWAIAGTTYTICVQQETAPRVRDYCTGRAIRAFESAISLDPDQLSHQVNLALVYTENPPADNPMRGILILRELNDEHPNNVLVMNTLARLAIKTGQFDRAIQRLERSIELEPENQNTICLLASAYSAAGPEFSAKATEFSQKCSPQ